VIGEGDDADTAGHHEAAECQRAEDDGEEATGLERGAVHAPAPPTVLGDHVPGGERGLDRSPAHTGGWA
jgi:hypothetical protein